MGSPGGGGASCEASFLALRSAFFSRFSASSARRRASAAPQFTPKSKKPLLLGVPNRAPSMSVARAERLPSLSMVRTRTRRPVTLATWISRAPSR